MNKLSEKQQQLLGAYYDQELGFLRRLYVEKFLLQSATAQEYLQELKALSGQITQDYSQLLANHDRQNQWNVLNLRLLQEEKNSLYQIAESGDRKLANIWQQRPIASTLATAVVAFCLGFIFKLGYLNFQPQDTSIAKNLATSTVANTASSNQQSIPVALASNRQGAPILRRQTVELDWVKSDGRIRMIAAPNGAANIIWVKAPRNGIVLNQVVNK